MSEPLSRKRPRRIIAVPSLLDLATTSIARHRSALISLSGVPEQLMAALFRKCFHEATGSKDSSAEILSALLPFCCASSSLTAIDLDCPPLYIMTESDLLQLSTTLAAKPNLRDLRFSRMAFPSMLTAFVAAPGGFPPLRRLSLRGVTYLNDALFLAFVRGCAASLQSLCISGTLLSAGTVAEAVPRLAALTELDMTDCGTTAVDSAAVAAVAAGCPGLRRLFLKGCWRVDDAGVAAIARGLTRLELLDLGAVPALTDLGVGALAALPELTTLSLWNARAAPAFGDPALSALARGLPALQDLNIFGVEVKSCRCR
ncbi:unnamed protein product [Phaeothamnion confervicola]